MCCAININSILFHRLINFFKLHPVSLCSINYFSFNSVRLSHQLFQFAPVTVRPVTWFHFYSDAQPHELFSFLFWCTAPWIFFFILMHSPINCFHFHSNAQPHELFSFSFWCTAPWIVFIFILHFHSEAQPYELFSFSFCIFILMHSPMNCFHFHSDAQPHERFFISSHCNVPWISLICILLHPVLLIWIWPDPDLFDRSGYYSGIFVPDPAIHNYLYTCS